MIAAAVRALCAALVLAIVATGASSANAPDPRLATWDQRLQELSHEHPLPGLAAAVVIDRHVAWSKGYGFADEDGKVAITPDTPFWIASLTKTFVGLLFLQLEAEGEIDLEDRINAVPGWDGFCSWLTKSGNVFGRNLHCDAPITIRNILNHTSNGEPGAAFFYNPFMYSRLSRYLEHRLGDSVEDVEGHQNTMAKLVEDKILHKASMKTTMASQWQRNKAMVFFDMATGFGIDDAGDLIKRPRPERELAGGAGIVSTVADLARYDIALDSGKLASPAIMEKLFQPATANDGHVLPYAFGWYVQDFRGERLLWHSGWDEEAGFSGLILKVPNRHLTMILLANGEGLKWDNPLDGAAIEKSPFAAAFLDLFVFGADATRKE